MQSRTLEILVGFFVCLGVAAIFLLTFRVASLDTVGSGSNNYRVTARFDTIGGLASGASVRMAGVKIGRVKGITIDPTSFQAVTTLEIDADDLFASDSFVNIVQALPKLCDVTVHWPCDEVRRFCSKAEGIQN